MSKVNATLVRDWNRLRKPPEFPLGVHKPSAQFCKKIRGAIRYFGKLPNWRAAWALYDSEREAWEAGRNPRETVTAVAAPDGSQSLVRAGDRNITLYALVTLFIARENERRQRINPTTGKPEISDDSFLKCRRCVERAVRFFGDTRPALSILPDEWAKFRHALYVDFKLRPAAVQHNVIYVRCLSTWATETAKLTPEAFHFGDAFDYVPKSEMRVARRKKAREHGEKVFPVEQIPLILEEVKQHPQLHACMLLALNGAMNATDCSELTTEMIDWKELAIDFDRGKTGIPRFFFLWPETAEALRIAMLVRPTPADEQHAKRVFLTSRGVPWVRRRLTNGADGLPAREGHTDSLSQEMIKVLKALDEKHPEGVGGMKFKRGDVSFSAGRHTAQSILASFCDRDTRMWISGHSHRGMDDHYLHVTTETKDSIWRAVMATRQAMLEGKSVNPGTVTVRTWRPRLLDGPPPEVVEAEEVGA
ncbi:MAG TPA: hypothetical protein VGR35_15515 [Tepidisphaeraceae bacterium]|nr:hypothetical protein [Tepidisphaeraceae bacterium]